MFNKTVSKATVYRWVDRISKSGVSARTSPGKPRSVRTKTFIAKVKRNVCLNKKRKSARQIAREEGCDHKIVGQVIKQDLGLKAYKKVRVPALTDARIAQRHLFAHWIKDNFNRTNLVASSYSRTRRCSIRTVRSTSRTAECMPSVDKRTTRTVVYSRRKSIRQR